jgi:hypothetical protein
VSIDVLCNGVNDNVCAVVERVLDIRGEEGVVDYDKNAVLVCDGGDFADVNEGEGWVGRGFDPDQLCLWTDELCDVDFEGGTERDLDPVCEGDLCEVSVGSAVYV